jgi:antitoxin PrlF
MSYSLTVKSQVTLPKAMRQHLGVQPGSAIDYEALPDGRVAIFPVKPPAAKDTGSNPFRKFIGIGCAQLSTEEILRETRGEDAMR